MKIILSRKGFDSTRGNGARPSPVINGTLVPLPIPSAGDPCTYGSVVINGHHLGQIVEDLTRCRIRSSTNCHLDPDLDRGSLRRAPGWYPAFGQSQAAQSHLANQGVGKGDLFLFFGWYKEAKKTNGRWQFVRGAPNFHVIYGWMLVEEVISLPDGARATGRLKPFDGHPHLSGAPRPQNTLYLASKDLRIAGVSRPGGGIFQNVSSARILTEPGQKYRSRWKLPEWFHPKTHTTLSHHDDPKRWGRRANGCSLQSVGIGQEFVLKAAKPRLATQWLARVFDGA